MEWVETYAETLGVTLTREEVAEVLRLAREVAHRTGDRTNAPVAAYLAGKFVAGEAAGTTERALDLAEGLLPPPAEA
jgi:hypothetical protein